MSRSQPVVVLVGRPNVGKSTLFNRIVGGRRAIVAPVAGTTRDSLARPASWGGLTFELADTGGLYGASEDPLHDLVVEQGKRAIARADLLIFVVDGREGLVSGDEQIAKELHETGLPIVLAVNKTDDKRGQAGVAEFYQLAIEPVLDISAEHGNGIGDLLDEVIRRLRQVGFVLDATRDADAAANAAASGVSAPADDAHPRAASEPRARPRAATDETRIAIVGRPNVGKSSLLNRLLKEERVLVSDMPGTTRDAIDAVMTWHRRKFRIIDTAGMRRPGRVRGGGKIEAVSVGGSHQAIFDADVVALLIDSLEGPTDQDAAIGGEADRAGRGVVIVANKWDLVKSTDHHFVEGFDDEIRRKMKFLDYAPILHISALTGERAPKVLETIDKIADVRRKRVPTPALNKFLEEITRANPPVSPGRKRVRILYAAQIGVAPPSFVFFTNVATTFHFSYERFLVNQLREHFGFVGSPIRVQVRRRAKSEPGAKRSGGSGGSGTSGGSGGSGKSGGSGTEDRPASAPSALRRGRHGKPGSRGKHGGHGKPGGHGKQGGHGKPGRRSGQRKDGRTPKVPRRS